MKLKVMALCTVVATSALFGNARAAGFDCSKARLPAEKMICSSSELSMLDETLNELCRSVEQETAGWDGETGKRINPIRDEQLRWLKKVRNPCGSISCLSQAYKARIEQIKKDWARALPSE